MLVHAIFARALYVFTRDRSAVTAIEYALIASIIAMLAITGIHHTGAKAAQSFNSVTSEL
jgi:Flp pilus assembly pilin Flp